MGVTYTLTVTSQGQVSIPAEIRRRWGILKSGRITLTLRGKKQAVVEPAPDILDLAGSFSEYAKINKGLTLAQILKKEKQAIEDGWLEHYINKEKRSGNKLFTIRTW